MKKFVLLLAVVFGLLFVVSGCGQASQQSAGGNDTLNENPESNGDLQKFNVGYLPTTGHSLYFIAEEEGYFEEQGLDVELFSFTNSGEGINAVVAGKLDVGTFGTAAPLAFEEKGAELTFIGGQMGAGAGVVATKEQAEALKDPKQFAGKRVATVRLATGDVVWRGELHEAGIDWEKDVEIVEMSSPADVIVAVKKGEVDAGVVWVPFVEKAKQEGLEIVAYSDDYMDNHVCGRLIASQDNFEEDYDAYVRFLTAMIKAEKFEQNPANKDQAVKDVAEYIKVDSDIIEKDLYDGYLDQTVDPNKNAILAFRETMVNIGYLKEEKDISSLIKIDAYKEALYQLLKENKEDPYYQKLVDRFEVNNF
jgi:NitT/TauT family transport system substrate-binding protein